jgi:methionine biosynthesis protein MetW
MPVAEHLPHSWYDTPNIHLCTFRDFERMCQEKALPIIERFVVDDNYLPQPLANRFPNVFGHIAFYRLGRRPQ